MVYNKYYRLTNNENNMNEFKKLIREISKTNNIKIDNVRFEIEQC